MKFHRTPGIIAFLILALSIAMFTGCKPKVAETKSEAPKTWQYMTFTWEDSHEDDQNRNIIWHPVLIEYEINENLIGEKWRITNDCNSAANVLNSLSAAGWELASQSGKEYTLKRANGDHHVFFFTHIERRKSSQ